MAEIALQRHYNQSQKAELKLGWSASQHAESQQVKDMEGISSPQHRHHA